MIQIGKLLVGVPFLLFCLGFYSSRDARWTTRDPLDGESSNDANDDTKRYNTPNLYQFAGNAPLNNIDSLGRDITLTTGNKNAWKYVSPNRYLHQEICVDFWMLNDEKCCWIKMGRQCFSFGLDEENPVAGYGPSWNWLGMESLRGASIFNGIVYRTEDQGLEDTLKLPTTVDQDEEFLPYLQGKVGAKDVYGPLRHNCRTFSQAMYEEAKKRYSGNPAKEGLRKCEEP